MARSPHIYRRFLVVFSVLGVAGIGAVLYTLVHQRVVLPFDNEYTVRAEFTAADGVVSGFGQPVNVVGVKVGQVTTAQLNNGRAIITMKIKRDRLARVYGNATAVLEPITPLADMQINLDPGTADAGPMPTSGVIDVASTSAPVQLSDLLSTLDVDTREFLTSLISSLSRGFSGRGADVQKALKTFGPTTRDIGRVSEALASRRRALADLVHNVGVITAAASDDHELASVVAAGDATLSAVASQDRPLRKALSELPPTLAVTKSTLNQLGPFADQLGPTATALTPAVSRLPSALKTLRPFSNEASTAIRRSIRPFVASAQPVVSDLVPTVKTLRTGTPKLTQSFQVLKYLVNEVAYNKDPKGTDRGFLFWTDWFAHNFNSALSFGDAHGGIGRALVLANCYGLEGIPELQKLFGITGLCPR